MLRCSSVIMLYKPSQRHCHFLLTCSVPLLSSSTPVPHQPHHRCLVPRVSHLHIFPSLVQIDSLSGRLLFFAPVHPARLTCPPGPPGPLLCFHCNNFWFVASVTDFLPIVANLATFPEAISPPCPKNHVLHDVTWIGFTLSSVEGLVPCIFQIHSLHNSLNDKC